MRICGKRASWYSQIKLAVMIYEKVDPEGEKLSDGQLKEIKKVYQMRKGVNKNDVQLQGRV